MSFHPREILWMAYRDNLYGWEDDARRNLVRLSRALIKDGDNGETKPINKEGKARTTGGPQPAKEVEHEYANKPVGFYWRGRDG